MRTLIVVHGFPPAAQGGAEICAFGHATTIAREYGDDVLVIAREDDHSRPEYALRRERRNGIEIAWINNTFSATRAFAETYDNPAITALAGSLIDAFRPDVAHAHHLTCLSTGIVPLLASRGVPVIFTLHDYWLICHRGQLLDRHLRVCDGPEPDGCHDCLGLAASAPPAAHRATAAFKAVERQLPEGAARALRGAAERAASLVSSDAAGQNEARARLDHMRAICGHVTRFVSPSRSVRDRFVAFGVPPDRIEVVANGIDHAPFASLTRATSSTLRVGFLGSLMVSKGAHVLLEAAALLPAGAATFEIFGAPVAYHGDDSYRATLAPLLAREGVRQHGSVPHDAIARVFGQIDLLVVPSIWPENSPLVIQEAFLAGVPVVASRIGGLPEMVLDGVNGLLFNPGDASDLARVLGRFEREPGLLDTLRRGIRPVPALAQQVAALRELATGAVARATAEGSRRAGPAAPHVAAIVLNYRAADETLLAVRSLAASRRRLDQIVVVDNDTQQPCAAMLDGVPARVRYVPTGRNLGFSGGVNAGIREARSQGATHVLLVNSDVIVPPDTLGTLLQTLQTSPDTGIVGPLVLGRSAPDVVASFGIDFDPASGRMRHADHGAGAATLNGAHTRIVDAASGAVLLISLDTIDRVGDFDESFFFSFEEIDFCLRARRAGLRTVVTRDAVVYHEGGQSMGSESPRRLYFAARNHLRVASSQGGNAWQATTRSLLVAGYNLAHAITAPGGTIAQRVGAVLRGVRDYRAGRFGEDRRDG